MRAIRAPFPALALAALLAATGCGLLGGGEPEAPPEPCPPSDLPARQLLGGLVRQPRDVSQFEALAAGGKAARSGSVARLTLGERSFRVRPTDDGGLEGRRAHAAPIAGLTGRVASVSAWDVTFTEDGQDYVGLVAVGKPTPGARVPTAGEARFSGPVDLRLQSAAAAGEVRVSGTIDFDLGYGSQQVAMAIHSMHVVGAAPQALPFAQLEWSGIGMCGSLIGSNGQGGFRTSDAEGRSVNFAGAGGGSPRGAAVLNAALYGVSDAKPSPAAIGGVLLIQGDQGVISGAFAAEPAN
jgi:hypothetical protein